MATTFLGLLASVFGIGCGHSAGRASAEAFHAFVDECTQELRQKMEALVDEYKIDQYTSFKFDQPGRRMVFSDDAGHELDCKIQVVGTYSEESKTWLWAWASPWILEDLARDSRKLKDYGTRHGYDRLTTPKWDGDESDGWAMTAIAAKLGSAKGAYRLPNRQGFIFMVFKDVERRAGATSGP